MRKPLLAATAVVVVALTQPVLAQQSLHCTGRSSSGGVYCTPADMTKHFQELQEEQARNVQNQNRCNAAWGKLVSLAMSGAPKEEGLKVVEEMTGCSSKENGATQFYLNMMPTAEQILRNKEEAEFRRKLQEEAQRRTQEEQHKQFVQRTDAVHNEGYQLSSVKDFVLDGRQLAKEDARVALEGVYVKYGNIGMLYASLDDALIAKTRNTDPPRVPLLIEDADRALRERVLSCQATQNFGCDLSVKGEATICNVWNAFGVTHDEPCIKVEGGW